MSNYGINNSFKQVYKSALHVKETGKRQNAHNSNCKVTTAHYNGLPLMLHMNTILKVKLLILPSLQNNTVFTKQMKDRTHKMQNCSIRTANCSAKKIIPIHVTGINSIEMASFFQTQHLKKKKFKGPTLTSTFTFLLILYSTRASTWSPGCYSTTSSINRTNGFRITYMYIHVIFIHILGSYNAVRKIRTWITR
jgi:hypothetical protein